MSHSEREAGSSETSEKIPSVKVILTLEKIEDGIAYCDVSLKLTEKGSEKDGVNDQI